MRPERFERFIIFKLIFALMGNVSLISSPQPLSQPAVKARYAQSHTEPWQPGRSVPAVVCETWGRAVCCTGAVVTPSPSPYWSGTRGVGLSGTSMQKRLAEMEVFALGGRILLSFQADSFNLGFSAPFLLCGVT